MSGTSAYLVMEYVDGLPLDTYCREHNLDVRARLRLFLKVCDAVSYAHRILVIHRDLKPSNILITREGNPKLVDFGISKFLGNAGDETLATENRWRVTLRYASPEQIDRNERLHLGRKALPPGAGIDWPLCGATASFGLRPG